MSQELPFSSIVETISQLCQEKRTGTMFITHKSSLLAQLVIQEGEIVFLFSRGNRDNNALPMLLTIKSASIRFIEGVVPIKTAPPPTAEILKFLADAALADDDTQDHSLSIKRLSSSMKTVLKGTLHEFIGPIASLVCDDCFRVTTNVDVAIQMLMDEIPTPSAAARFQELIRKRIN